MLRILNQPYPKPLPGLAAILRASAAGVFVAFFLWVFEPFGLSLLPMQSLPWLCAGYGLVTTLAMMLTGLPLAWFIGRFIPDTQWTTGRQLLWVLFHIVVIAVGNMFFSHVFNVFPLSTETAAAALGMTLAVGVFPSAGFVFADYTRLLRLHSQGAEQVQQQLPAAISQDEGGRLVLTAENGKDRLGFHERELLYIESGGNYATVWLTGPNGPRRELLRSSLSKLEAQISQPLIVRCHRSYIVNLGQVAGVKGNAQGYKLSLCQGVGHVPVSRAYTDSIGNGLKRRPAV